MELIVFIESLLFMNFLFSQKVFSFLFENKSAELLQARWCNSRLIQLFLYYFTLLYSLSVLFSFACHFTISHRVYFSLCT